VDAPTGRRLAGPDHDASTEHGRRIADIALAGILPLRVSIPFWFRLRIDLPSMRVLANANDHSGHFMDQRYSAFNVPVRIAPPTAN